MKIDLVVGNPPYNKDMYIPFVEFGHNLASKYSLWITPAKWATKVGAQSGKQNKRFRDSIFPNISKIFYEQDSSKIFDICLSGGITYFLVDKSKEYEIKLLNGKEKKLIKGLPLDINDIELNILNKVKSKEESLIINNNKFGRSYYCGLVASEIKDGGRREDLADNNSGILLMDASGGYPLNENSVRHLDMAKSLYKLSTSFRTYEGKIFRADILKPGEITGRGHIILTSGTEEECKSAYSYFSSNLIFWLSIRFFGQKGADNSSFTYVPDPGVFDHIFTDEELYKKYNLTEEEIDIIESVIKKM